MGGEYVYKLLGLFIDDCFNWAALLTVFPKSFTLALYDKVELLTLYTRVCELKTIKTILIYIHLLKHIFWDRNLWSNNLKEYEKN